MTRRIYALIGRCALALSLLCVSALTAQTQTRVTCDETIQDSQLYKIRSVKADARYSRLPVPPKGTLYTNELESRLLNDLKTALDAEQNRESIIGATAFQIQGTASTVVELDSVTSCVKVLDAETCRAEVGQDKCVDIRLDAKSLRFSPTNIGENILSAIPRSNKPTLISHVPKPILAFNPKFGADYDREFGAAQVLQISTNLLDLPKSLRGEALAVQRNRLDLVARGRKSLSNAYYETDARLTFSNSLPSKYFEGVKAEAGFAATHQPYSTGNYLRNAFSFGAGLKIKPDVRPVTDVTVAGKYRWSSNRFFGNNGAPAELMTENALEVRAVLNGRLAKDFLRLGVWFDLASPERQSKSYRRVAGLLGYAKDFGRGNQTVGLETIIGAGRAWGELPQYALFYGGNSTKNFIYEAVDSPVLTSFPVGPLLRSFGSGQATAKNRTGTAARGGTSYFHINVNVSIPIPSLSQPLIPSEDLELEDPVTGEPTIRNTRQIIKNQAKSGQTILRKIYEKQGVPQAADKARREFKSINSALNFLVDQANIYSLKPLFMFDAARINGAGDFDGRTRYGVGGGLQLTLVVAKFEAGYIHTVRRTLGDDRGNFVMRLFFQNLF